MKKTLNAKKNAPEVKSGRHRHRATSVSQRCAGAMLLFGVYLVLCKSLSLGGNYLHDQRARLIFKRGRACNLHWAEKLLDVICSERLTSQQER